VSNHPQQIIEAARGKVPEQILGAAFGKPRGSNTAIAGGVIGGAIGGGWAAKQHKGAEAMGIRLGSPGAIAITPANLVTMTVGVTMGGQIKEIKEILSVVPLTHVDSVQVKRMGLGGVMVISAGGHSFKLEGKVGDMREFAAAFDRVKATAS